MYRIGSNPRSPAWAAMTVLVVAATLATIGSGMRDLYSVSLVTVGALALVASSRAAQWWGLTWPRARARRPRRVVLVGSGLMAGRVAPLVTREGDELLGFVGEAVAGEPPARLLGAWTDLPRLVLDLRVDRVILTDSAAETWALLSRLGPAADACEIDVVPGPYELALCRPTCRRLGDIALIRLPRPGTRRGFHLAKRCFDGACSAALLLLSSPLLALAMLAIRLSGPGPALFRQQRVGKDGRLFYVLKLRTMVENAEAEGPRLCAGRADPRLTPVGRWLRRTHLDELPQLWNVLRGEMSLIGPRPERPEFVEQFERDFPEYAERHRILPGITGLAQVCGSYHSSPREKLRFDLMYLYHSSPGLDANILLRTVAALFG